jgi:hypothetical protein
MFGGASHRLLRYSTRTKLYGTKILTPQHVMELHCPTPRSTFKKFGQAGMRVDVDTASEISPPLLDATGTFRPGLKNDNCLDRDTYS